MRNKGAVIILTVLVSLLCIYYLSFTFVSRSVKQDATEYATQAGTIDFSKKQSYLDSVWKEPVYNLFGVDYTYQEVKNTELNLGLDLQGGMHVTLEVSPIDILKGLSGDSKDAAFLEALERAKEAKKTSGRRFTELFYEAYQDIKPEGKLSDIFANASNKGRISYSSSDEEVLDMIDEEVEDAIDRSYKILRTRIDRFGTSQPNIQRLQGSGRIQVEIPGAENPARVRKLLQNAAKLEFWRVAEIQQYQNSLVAINNLLVNEQKLNKEEAQEELTEEEDALPTDREDVPSQIEEQLEEEDAEDLAAQLEEEGDSTNIDQLGEEQVSPLFSLLRSQYGLVYELDDTTTINRIMQREEVQNLLPNNLKFLWQVKPREAEDGTKMLELYAVVKERGGKAALEGDVITDARQDYDESGSPAVSMQMNASGGKKWAKITRNNIGSRIAIVLDDFVYSAPVVQGEIPNGNSSISGNFTIEESKDLANILKAGTLPAPTTIVEEAVIGPTLGKEAQKQGVVSILAGLAIVVVFMIAYYSKGGFIANLALVFNVFFIMGILAQLNAALTLPGIAGIVLTIGMAIDANVLIFERIKEELSNGAGIKAAISAGYNKAYSSIIDANLTTFLTAVVLYTLGMGPVRGFAITLMIGIVCSFFSAVFITRLFVEWMAKKGDASSMSFATGISRNLFQNLNTNFLAKRKVTYTISAIFIGIGMIALFAQGGLNWGVDFTGGRSYVVQFPDAVTASELKTELSDNFEGKGTEVKTFGANNTLKVTTAYMANENSDEADVQVQNRLIEGVADFTGLKYVKDGNELGDDNFSIISSSKVTATIADDITEASLEAILVGLLVIFLYILARFSKWEFGVGAVVALFHDTLAVISAFAIAGLLGISFEIDQVFIAAILTIIGYSINDTVVVFDRVRETIGTTSTKTENLTIFNTAINNTISRTMITSLTTLIVVIILFIFGGEVLRGFSFALLIGIIVGTYSSIFIATPTVLDLSKKEKKQVKNA